MEHRHGILDCSLGGNTLYALNHDAFRFFCRSHFGIVDDFVDILHRIGACLVFHALNKLVLCFLGSQTTDGLQLCALLGNHLVKLAFFRVVAGNLLV